ncbi:unnamed protein product, partial [Rotaria sp. Silwood2]
HEDIKSEESNNQSLKSKISNSNSVKNAPVKSTFGQHGYDNVQLHFDIWRSMNGRFNQRQIDSHSSDAKWCPFQDTS